MNNNLSIPNEALLYDSRLGTKSGPNLINPNLGGLFRSSFLGKGEVKLQPPPSPSLKQARYNFSRSLKFGT